MTKPLIPDSFLNEIEGLAARESDDKFAVGDKFLEGWDEMGTAFSNHFKSERKAHAWFVASVAASCGVTNSAIRHRYRVSRHVTQEYRNEYPAYTWSHWRAMLTEDKLDENLEWANETFDRHGHPPSPEDIRDFATGKNGMATWEKRLERILTDCRGMEDEAPHWLIDLCQRVLDTVESNQKE